MNYTILPNTDVKVSRLSFGTASLHRLFFGSERQKLLFKAFDLGITHFDTSPYYGYGIAEKELGKFFKHIPDQFTVATKVGLYPPGNRSMEIDFEVFIKKFIGKFYSPLSKPMVDWSVKKADESFHRSLKRLGIEHVDFLFLHEPDINLINSEEFLNWLTSLKRKGKIRYWGLAGEAELIEAWIKRKHPFCTVIQTRDSLSQKESNFLFKYVYEPQFTYGYLSTDLQKSKMSPIEILKNALKRNTKGSILFSTRKLTHLREVLKCLQ